MGVNEGFVVGFNNDLSSTYILAASKLLMLIVDSLHLPWEAVNLIYYRN
jgi:hypothetical protein